MKNTLLVLVGLTLLTATLAAHAQFSYTTNNGTITITGYTGPGGAVTIPDTINGLPVTTIGGFAFRYNFSLTSVMIPDSVTNIWGGAFAYCPYLASVTIPGSVASIGGGAFAACSSLPAITVDAAIGAYSSLDGVLFNKDLSTLIQYPSGKAGNYSIPGSVTGIANSAFAYSLVTNITIPSSVATVGALAFYYCNLTTVTILNGLTNIENEAFFSCSSLTSVTIPRSVTSIGSGAFYECYSLQAAFFKGDAPVDGGDVFKSTSAIVYYLPGTTGWGAMFGDVPTRLWNPLMQPGGIGPAGFGFNITGTADIPIVIEAATSLANSAWVPLKSLNLTNGVFYFSDPNWKDYPARFYRIRSP